MFVAYKIFILFLFSASILADDCVISNFEDVENATKFCTDLIVDSMSVPGGVTLELDLLDGATLTFQGNTSFGVENWDGPLMRIKGNGITVHGAPDSVLDGVGRNYWDGMGEWGTLKPRFFRIQATGAGSPWSNVTVKNCPQHCVIIEHSQNITIENWLIDVLEGDIEPQGHNTDGFQVFNSSYIEIRDTKVYNQDDCIAVQRGEHMVFNRMYCHGGHGLSMSVGWSNEDDNTVEDINFLNSVVENSANAIHLKTHTDAGTGYYNNVTYDNITFTGSTSYGINIQEDYANGGGTGVPRANIPIRNLFFKNINGSVDSNAVGVYIFCADGGCADWFWTNVSVSSQRLNKCNFAPEGFDCYGF